MPAKRQTQGVGNQLAYRPIYFMDLIGLPVFLASATTMLVSTPQRLSAIGQFLFLSLACATAFGQIHHDFKIRLEPDSHRILVVDRLTLPADHTGPVHFRLHQGLNPQVLETTGARLNQTPATAKGHRTDMDAASREQRVPVEHFIVTLPVGMRHFTLRYSGEIFHPIKQYGEEYARSFSISAGLISSEGVFLAGSSYWYPCIADTMVTFGMEIEVPKGWLSISQGRRTQRAEHGERSTETWIIDKPQEDIYLVAGPFSEYRQPAGTVEALVFLRQADRALAQKYLDATAQYLEMYRQLLGPYPYSKFALVENFWETGYGMPSFTLLGPKVIRFPFILHTSYPHEILHNWWGNGVYVDYETGNWAEGLTSYLADHLLKEQRGEGVAYRRSTLQRYTDYVKAQKDFPLTAFRGRHNSVTEAVGYGKTLMLFHMLRQELGDKGFLQALQRFYRRHQFTVASFGDVAATFNDQTDQSLAPFFEQWVGRIGAPALRVHNALATPKGNRFTLSADIEQVHAGPAYRLKVPIAVHMEGVEEAYQTNIVIDSKHHELKLDIPARPVRLDVDPEFDVFRQLDRNEIPPAISQAFGAEKALVVLPSAAPTKLRQAYGDLAQSWQKARGTPVQIVLDNDLAELPTDRTVWLFGWENHFRTVLQEALDDYDFEDHQQVLIVNGTRLTRARHSVVVLARHPANPNHALAWVATDAMAALPGLGRKLPHYGKYSYLGFVGDEPTNVVKGQWPVVNSPMSVAVVQQDGKRVRPTIAKLAPRQPLAQLPTVFSAPRMMQDIAYLAADNMAGRGLGTPELDRAADYIAKQFRAAGLHPLGDKGKGYFQSWTTKTGEPKHTVTLKNVVGVIPGRNAEWAGQSVVIGAHYDHLGRGWPDVHKGDKGKIHPGADDNASGVAVLLELARSLGRKWKPERTIVFVAFTAEEAERLGSIYYVQHPDAYPIDKVMAMLNLDTVGRLGKKELLVLGSGSTREWVDIFRGAGFVTGVPIKPVADEFGSSDQRSFLDAGVPAVQLFTGPHSDFHRPSDTIDKIDAAGLVKTAAVLKEAVEYLASRPKPLSAVLANFGRRPGTRSGQGLKSRRVMLGTVPDYTYTGKGVRLSGVVPDTPAERAGLQKDDVILQINDTAINDLREFSNFLHSLQPGDAVNIHLIRDDTEQSVHTRVVER
jgi:aminopeptidase N